MKCISIGGDPTNTTVHVSQHSHTHTHTIGFNLLNINVTSGVFYLVQLLPNYITSECEYECV